MKLVRVSEAIEIVSAVTGRPQQRRVAILQRDDGLFTFAEERRSTKARSLLKDGGDFSPKAFSQAQKQPKQKVT